MVFDDVVWYAASGSKGSVGFEGEVGFVLGAIGIAAILDLAVVVEGPSSCGGRAPDAGSVDFEPIELV